MTKSYQNEEDFIYNGKQSCKFAYALGREGFTALCNIIEHSPLFYSDIQYDDDIYEDDFLELEELRAELMDGISAEHIREKEQKLLQASRHLSEYKKLDTENLMILNKDHMLSKVTENNDANKELNALLKKLEHSHIAGALLDFAKKHGVSFKPSNQIFNVFYDRESATIFVNTKTSASSVIINLAKALREVWQHRKGMLIHPLTFHPDDAVLLNRLQKADVVTVQCRVAWELKLAGEEQTWTDLMGSVFYDLAASFAKEAISDFRSLNNGQAAKACFESWFLSGRCKTTDKKLIQSMLADHNGLVFDNPEISRNATMDVISGMTEMPSGKNYLSGSMSQIVEDPLYAEIRDRSNANFLWFIKFERSFRDSEQNLQEKSSPNAKASSAAKHHKDLNNEQSDQNVVTFQSVPNKSQSSKKNDRHDAGQSGRDDNIATVYYLEHFQKPSQKVRSSE